jgi:hypothetical protein
MALITDPFDFVQPMSVTAKRVSHYQWHTQLRRDTARCPRDRTTIRCLIVTLGGLGESFTD